MSLLRFRGQQKLGNYPYQHEHDRKERRTYDEQFKHVTVVLHEDVRKATQLARELGISHRNLRDSKDHFGARAAAVEIAFLRRELDAIRAQNDI